MHVIFLTVIIESRYYSILQIRRWKRQIELFDRLDFGKRGILPPIIIFKNPYLCKTSSVNRLDKIILVGTKDGVMMQGA